MLPQRAVSLGFLQWQRQVLGLPMDAVESEQQLRISGDPLDYDISQAMNGIHHGLVDSHCHIDFIFARMKQRYNKSFSTFQEFMEKFSSEFPPSFGGCIAVFCEPSKWMKVRKIAKI